MGRFDDTPPPPGGWQDLMTWREVAAMLPYREPEGFWKVLVSGKGPPTVLIDRVPMFERRAVIKWWGEHLREMEKADRGKQVDRT